MVINIVGALLILKYQSLHCAHTQVRVKISWKGEISNELWDMQTKAFPMYDEFIYYKNFWRDTMCLFYGYKITKNGKVFPTTKCAKST